MAENGELVVGEDIEAGGKRFVVTRVNSDPGISMTTSESVSESEKENSANEDVKGKATPVTNHSGNDVTDEKQTSSTSYPVDVLANVKQERSFLQPEIDRTKFGTKDFLSPGNVPDIDVSSDPGEPVEDGAVVVSIPVPTLTRVNSAPDMSRPVSGENGLGSGKTSKDKETKTCNKNLAVTIKKKMEMTKEEIVKKYRLHFFVGLIFLITVLSVSLSWYYRNMATELLYKSQAIFFDPRSRVLTLADPNSEVSIRGQLGRDMPLWQLPLHCPIVMGDNPHFKECTWKRNAILRIVHFRNDFVQCYNISWESLHPKHVPYDCFDVDAGQWYGPSNQSESFLPIRGEFLFQPTQYTVKNNGLFSSVVDFYWLSSKGVALRVHADDPIQVYWNRTGNSKFCILSNYTGPFYHQKLAKTAPHMNYTLCNGIDTLKTHLFMQTLYAPKDKVTFPPESAFKGNHWSLKSISKTENISQGHVIDLVNKLEDEGFVDNKITLDGNWQTEHGDLTFDPVRFNNLSEMSEVLTANDCTVTLCVSPYFHYTSQNFHKGVTNSMFVKDAGGEVTGLTSFQGGLAAVLDIFGQDGRSWYKNKLKDLAAIPSITSHRLTYGSGAWLPYKPYFHNETGTPNTYRKLLSKTLGSISKFLIVEHTSDSREVTKFLPVVTEIGTVGMNECLLGTIETALTLGLMGYPFVMADGIQVKGVEQKEVMEPLADYDELPDRELYIRWLLLSSFFPARQFSTPPWLYGDSIIGLANNISAQRHNLLLKELRNPALVKEVKEGLPILRPVWWLDPGNETVHGMKIKDEFLIGDKLLVAPILCKGVTARNIYVPPGVWEDLQLGNIILGPNTLTKYRLGLNEIGLFKRRETVGDVGKDDL